MHDDRELLLAWKAGDEDAFARFYDRHARRLYVYLLAIVERRETAEELLQETFLALVRHIRRLEIRREMRPFLLVTARHRAYDRLRRERRGREALRRHEDLFFRVHGGTYTEDPLAAREAPEELSRLLHRLPAEQREAVVLKELVGCTHREIAEVAGIPENTAASRHRYGMEKLRALALEGGRRALL